ncbi:MAG: PD-(D/E)XK nuclease family protein [Clostridia bacterium]|nr:PD-(D/E)XK nuclease family protein [Clostridia bacterium]
MIKIIGGRAGSGNGEYLLSAIKNQIENGNKKVIVTVPEQFTVVQEREILDALGNRLADGIEVLSFKRLCNFILSKTGGIARKYISDSGRFLLMHKAYEATSEKITSYKRIGNYTDFINKLLNLSDEFRTYGVSTDAIDDAFEEDESILAGKMKDLALIFATYRALLEKDFADKGDDIDVAAEKLRENNVFEGYTFFFSEFKSFSPQQRHLLEEIIRQAENAFFFFTSDNLANRDDMSLFHASAESAHEIRKICERIGREEPIIEYIGNKDGYFSPEIAHIEKNIYLTRPEKYEGEVKNVEVICAATEFDELEYIASDIQKKIINDGYKYSDFALITRNLDKYVNVIDSVFSRYGIPVFLDRTTDVLTKPLATLIFSAFDCVLYGYRYRDVVSYLKSGITGMSLDEVDMVDNYAFQWNINGNAWKREWKRRPGGFGKVVTEEEQKILDNLNSLRKRTVEQLMVFEKALKTDSAAEIAKAIYDMLVALDVPGCIETTVEKLSDDDRKYEAAQYEQLWDKMIEALDQTVMICTEPIKPEKYAKLLKQMLSGVQIGIIPTAVDEVLAGSAERVRAGDIKCSYLIGFNAGEFPQGSFAEGLITDSEKKKLETMDITLAPDGEKRAFDERFFVYNALTSAREKLVITYPKSDGAGASKKKSYVITMLCEMMPKLSERFLDDEIRNLEIYNRVEAMEHMLSYGKKAPGYLADILCGNDEKAFAKMVKDSINADKKKYKLANQKDVESLYRSNRFSATKFETYALCPFRYFCTYGLKLGQRKKYSIDNLEIGTFMHAVIERFVKETSDFSSVDIEKKVKELVDDYIKESIPDFDEYPERVKSVFGRMTGELCSFIENLAEDFKNSSFMPVAFELEIGKGGVAPIKMSDGSVIEGKIDRVDTYKKDGKLYVRIVDYKTGSKTLSFSELKNGISMQMFIYLFAIKQHGKDYFGDEIKLAGVLYTPVHYGFLQLDRNVDEETAKLAHAKSNKTNGLLLRDVEILRAMDGSGEFNRLPVSFNKDGSVSKNTEANLADENQFEHLEKFIIGKTEEIIKNIHKGEIGVMPYYDSSSMDKYVSCKYCDMQNVCRYERNGSCDREMEHIKADEFWSQLIKEDE